MCILDPPRSLGLWLAEADVFQTSESIQHGDSQELPETHKTFRLETFGVEGTAYVLASNCLSFLLPRCLQNLGPRVQAQG